MPMPPLQLSNADASSSRLDLNQAGKMSGINFAGQARTIPQFITQGINADRVTEDTMPAKWLMVAAGVMVLGLIVWGRK